MCNFKAFPTNLLTMIRAALLFAVLGFYSIQGFTQFSAGLYYNYFQPLIEEPSAAPQGVSAAILYRLPDTRWTVGFDFGRSVYDQRAYGATVDVPIWGLVTADVKEVSGFSHFNLLTRYTFIQEAALEPYAEGRVGLMAYSTYRNTGKGISADTGAQVLSSREMKQYFSCADFHGTSFQAGLGLGTIINLKHLVCPTEEDYGFEIKIDLGATCYLGSDGISQNNQPETTQALNNSAMSQLAFRAGVMIVFR